MIYGRPAPDAAIDQGDIIDGCPVLDVGSFDPNRPDTAEAVHSLQRVFVLTQTCDLANGKATRAVVALVHDAQVLVEGGFLKQADVRGPIRAGRVYGWYFLPANDECGLPELLVDLRQIHTVRLDLLGSLCRIGRRRARLQPPYREHLGRHPGDTYGRIGLPEPYPST